jgi:hypothetical protein
MVLLELIEIRPDLAVRCKGAVLCGELRLCRPHFFSGGLLLLRHVRVALKLLVRRAILGDYVLAALVNGGRAGHAWRAHLAILCTLTANTNGYGDIFLPESILLRYVIYAQFNFRRFLWLRHSWFIFAAKVLEL